jgi:hypothetical protein
VDKWIDLTALARILLVSLGTGVGLGLYSIVGK